MGQLRVLSLRSGDRSDVMSVRWLPTFVVFMATHDASVAQLHNFVRDATSWLASITGPTRPGVHNGAAVLPVLVARSCRPETRLEAERRQPRQEPVFPLPVLVELEARRAHTFAGARLWGLSYQRFVGEQQQLVIDGLAGETMSTGGGTGRRAGCAVVLAAGVAFLAAVVLFFLGLAMSG